MKYVHFVSNLVVQRVPHVGREEHEYYVMQNALRVADGALILSGKMTEAAVQTRTVPIVEICNVGKPDIYVAYSQEVEDLLGVPVRAIINSRDMAQHNAGRYFSEYLQERAERRQLAARLRRVQEWTFWQRIKFVFNRRLPQ